MGRITKARAYANGMVGLICWDVDDKIDGCVGFELVRVYEDSGERRPLASWVPFKGQSNPDWKPQDTSVWPVQRLMWRDLTLRQKRDSPTLRPTGETIHYEVRPVGPAGNAPPDVASQGTPDYTGPRIPLKYLGPAVSTNSLVVTEDHGDINSAFTNGVLSTQFLVHVFESMQESLTPEHLRAEMEKQGQIRTYLAGGALPLIKDFFAAPGASFHQALYELEDGELIDLIKGLAARDELILSSTSKDSQGQWDTENLKVRPELEQAGVVKTDRIFNNDHIGHNKFSVRTEGGTPVAVLTGSTNWTTTGLCAQSNNALILNAPAVAQAYLDYWTLLKQDTETFKSPATPTSPTNNKQEPEIRAADAVEKAPIALNDGTQLQIWFSPNTKATTKPSGANPPTPPDLSEVFRRMRMAKDLILFAVFQPSQSARNDVVRQAIDLGQGDSKLLVYGCLSDPSAMPNFVPKPSEGDDVRSDEQKQPHTFDTGNVHIVRATALDQHDIAGNFEREVLKSSPTAHAIIHDKIVVVDPLSPEGFVVTGSHNLGIKASYENDENLLILWNNPSLVRAYAVHVLDLWDHYRFRALQAVLTAGSNKAGFDGFLATDDRWMDEWLAADRRLLSRYFAEG